ncbi:MAG: peptidoglycan DD-metalloendopeptidase family protein [Gammaproteobacteria bacterium]|nr:peptidoglycan DD-metalloendopeptidase family protein [Gammaproteobacteria bacterium]
MPYLTPRPLLVILTVILISVLLNACAPPRPAPVVSREVGQQRTYAAKPGFYKVRSGDTIYSIAWRYGLDHREFARWNSIRPPYRIYPGRTLRVASPPSRSVVRNRQLDTKPAQIAKLQPNQVAKAKTAPKKQKISKYKIASSSRKLHWQWPTVGKVKVRYKRGDPSRKGVVLAGRLGQGVKAAEAGAVVYSGSGLIGYGQLLIIKHNKNYLSAYGHNKRLLVKEGDQVKRGAKIAEMGSNGSGNTVLHFEIRRNGVPVDPLPLLSRK